MGYRLPGGGPSEVTFCCRSLYRDRLLNGHGGALHEISFCSWRRAFVLHLDDLIGQSAVLGLMGDHDHGDSRAVDLFEQADNSVPGVLSRLLVGSSAKNGFIRRLQEECLLIDFRAIVLGRQKQAEQGLRQEWASCRRRLPSSSVAIVPRVWARSSGIAFLTTG